MIEFWDDAERFAVRGIWLVISLAMVGVVGAVVCLIADVLPFLDWSWLLTVASVAGAILVAFRRPITGQAIWVPANIGWVAWGVMHEAWSVVGLFSVYFVIASFGVIWGVVKRRKERWPT